MWYWVHYMYWLTSAAAIFVILPISWFGFLINQSSYFYTSSLSLISFVHLLLLLSKQVNLIIINRFPLDFYTRKLWRKLFEKGRLWKTLLFWFFKEKVDHFFITEYRICYLYNLYFFKKSAKHLKTKNCLT